MIRAGIFRVNRTAAAVERVDMDKRKARRIAKDYAAYYLWWQMERGLAYKLVDDLKIKTVEDQLRLMAALREVLAELQTGEVFKRELKA